MDEVTLVRGERVTIPEHGRLLDIFDRSALDKYGITAQDLERIEKYVTLLQHDLPTTVWEEAVSIKGEYRTSIIIHEIVELRELLKLGIAPLAAGKAVADRLKEHPEAHALALWEEHLYLQKVIRRKYGCRFEVATLIRANRYDELDVERFQESDVGVFVLESEEQVEKARMLLNELGRRR